MANLYNTVNNNSTNYSSFSSQQEPDEISLFLQQILLRSSSSLTPSDHLPAEPAMVPDPGRVIGPAGLNPSSGCSFAAASSSVGNLDNEGDEYEYESEEGVEAIAGETVPKPTPPRNSSKRSRAAEVHNLSEKRRRSRINEKMKALQNLIPNSNKTDKASMLDEAIEYLKQLQLQVQMLTMRNGLSLYPTCLPGMVQPNQISHTRLMDIYDTEKILTPNMTKPISVDQSDTPFGLKQAGVADFSTMIGSRTHESSMQGHFGNFRFSRSSKEKFVPPCPPLNDDCQPNSSTGAKATTSIPLETQAANLKESTSDICLPGGDNLLTNFVHNPIFSSHLNM